MNQEKAIDISLEYKPNPEGDNSFEVIISEGRTTLTYFASRFSNNQIVNAGDVVINFQGCIAIKYSGTEPDEELYTGWYDCESDFCEILNSRWVDNTTSNIGNYHHYLFVLNHMVFECIAENYDCSKPK